MIHALAFNALLAMTSQFSGGGFTNIAEYGALSALPCNSTNEAANDAAFASAIAATTSSGGGVFIPAGIYCVSQTIDLTSKVNIKLFGVSARASVIFSSVSSSVVIKASSSSVLFAHLTDFSLYRIDPSNY